MNTLVIRVGKKPLMVYVTSCLVNFNSNQEIIIESRGQLISRAVDVAEILRNKFLPDCKIDKIEIASESMIGYDKRERKVSTIAIHVILREKLSNGYKAYQNGYGTDKI